MSLKTKEAVTMYLEASKTNIGTNATNNVRVSSFPLKEKNKWIKTIALNTSEFPMKTLGLSLASISTGVMEGFRAESEGGGGPSLQERDPSTGNK